MPVTLTCQRCGKAFDVVPAVAHRRYCSRYCYDAARASATHSTCETCGKVFALNGQRVRSFCSDRCKGAGQVKDLSGRRFGKITVHCRVGRVFNRRGAMACALWWGSCDCGEARVFRGDHLGRTKSCGCKRLDANWARHRSCDTREYSTWKAMLSRCTNPRNSMFHLYGARGISVCERWRTFENFRDDMGARPPGRSIERIDTNGNYEPGNCRWATPREQMLNRRNTVELTFNGTTKPLSLWAEQLGVRWQVVYHRIQRGWSVARAVTTPLVYRRRPRSAA